jgi:hypothetical protein
MATGFEATVPVRDLAISTVLYTPDVEAPWFCVRRRTIVEAEDRNNAASKFTFERLADPDSDKETRFNQKWNVAYCKLCVCRTLKIMSYCDHGTDIELKLWYDISARSTMVLSWRLVFQ